MANQPITPQDRFEWSEDQIGSEVDGKVVLMNLSKGHYYGLDEIGSEIWRRLENGAEVGTLCSELAAAYRHDEAEVQRDVIALLEQMREQELIRQLP